MDPSSFGILAHKLAKNTQLSHYGLYAKACEV